jgi:putative membrane protein
MNVFRRAAAVGMGSMLAICVAAAHAQSALPTAAPSTKSAPSPMGTAVSAQDRRFIMTAAEAGAGEVALGQLAKDHAASTDVKDFAARMVSDHQKAGDQLKSIATARGVAPPDQPSKKDQATLDKLAKVQGADFDKAYVKTQLSAHKEAVALFTSEASKGKDAELKQFASSTLPTLKDHLQMVEQLSKAPTTSGKSTTMAPKS